MDFTTKELEQIKKNLIGFRGELMTGVVDKINIELARRGETKPIDKVAQLLAIR